MDKIKNMADKLIVEINEKTKELDSDIYKDFLKDLLTLKHTITNFLVKYE
jgi:hypothetical protein